MNLCLTVCLWMIRFCCEELITEKGGAHIVLKNLLKNQVLLSESMYVGIPWKTSHWSKRKKDICNVRGCCLERWNSFDQLRVSVGNYKNVLTTLRSSGKRSHDIHCDDVEWSRCWKGLQSTPMAILGAVFCAGHMLTIWSMAAATWASKSHDVLNRTCFTDLDFQRWVGDVTIWVCVVKAMVELQAVWHSRQLILRTTSPLKLMLSSL